MSTVDECTRDAMDAVRGRWAAEPMWWVMVAESKTKDQMKVVYRKCMRSRGYQAPDD